MRQCIDRFGDVPGAVQPQERRRGRVAVEVRESRFDMDVRVCGNGHRQNVVGNDRAQLGCATRFPEGVAETDFVNLFTGIELLPLVGLLASVEILILPMSS